MASPEVTTTATATAILARIIDLFFLNERAYEGLPYTLFHPGHWYPENATGQRSTVTQGVNRYSLNGTVQAACNLTQVGSAWYARGTASRDDTFSAYRYNWTSGDDNFSFAPVAITAGAEPLTGPSPTPHGSSSSGAGAVCVVETQIDLTTTSGVGNVCLALLAVVLAVLDFKPIISE
ncbi:c73d6011-4464-4152-a59d-2090e5260049 [Thermothielavioides terrestris]|uniref:Uncharacterized protein n=2 Tax=Thermothielavioides terrestris TaxID=2587410 RepID=G2RBV9_THETT|nr:uncharacterized protein THITE_2090779 [Thermothielavioides terrestris NRRL 8126]AEO69280.1 hypothetical protein THITE_2090779 [Thermothielavioides terrestris NRRL 8126]SPQ22445.1 c73d6011-4464-4152-a59d-2090e5260049 [Thermothielavioides terrestris]